MSMTEAYFEQDHDRFLVTCKGHATGSEAVCAGVSAIIYALAGWVNNYAPEGVKIELESGDALVTFKGGEAAQAAFDMALIGLKQIQLAEPERISVVHAEV